MTDKQVAGISLSLLLIGILLTVVALKFVSTEENVRDQKQQILKELTTTTTVPTSTTVQGGPQARCESYYPGQNVEAIIFPDGAIWCAVKKF